MAETPQPTKGFTGTVVPHAPAPASMSQASIERQFGALVWQLTFAQQEIARLSSDNADLREQLRARDLPHTTGGV